MTERPHTTSGTSPFRGPSLRDWGLLATALTFCGLAVFLLLRGADWRMPVVTLVFFGIGAVMFAARLVMRARQHRREFSKVEIAGGVDIPLSRTRLYLAAFACAAIGFSGAFLGGEIGPFFRGLCALVALVGVGLIGAMALNLIPPQSIRFDPEGLVMQQGRVRYRAPWDAVTRLAVTEMHSLQIVCLRLHDWELAEPLAGTPPEQVYKAFSKTRGWYDGDIAIAAQNFGLDAQLLAAALARYIGEPEARRDLADKARIEG